MALSRISATYCVVIAECEAFFLTLNCIILWALMVDSLCV